MNEFENQHIINVLEVMINIQCKKTKATFKHQSQKSFEGIDFFEI